MGAYGALPANDLPKVELIPINGALLDFLYGQHTARSLEEVVTLLSKDRLAGNA